MNPSIIPSFTMRSSEEQKKFYLGLIPVVQSKWESYRAQLSETSSDKDLLKWFKNYFYPIESMEWNVENKKMYDFNDRLGVFLEPNVIVDFVREAFSGQFEGLIDGEAKNDKDAFEERQRKMEVNRSPNLQEFKNNISRLLRFVTQPEDFDFLIASVSENRTFYRDALFDEILRCAGLFQSALSQDPIVNGFSGSLSKFVVAIATEGNNRGRYVIGYDSVFGGGRYHSKIAESLNYSAGGKVEVLGGGGYISSLGDGEAMFHGRSTDSGMFNKNLIEKFREPIASKLYIKPEALQIVDSAKVLPLEAEIRDRMKR